MNKNTTGDMPKNLSNSRPITSTLYKTHSTSAQKNKTLSSSTQTSTYKSPYSASSILQSAKNIVAPDTDRNSNIPTSSTSNHTPRTAIKNPPLLSTTTSSFTDNSHATSTIASHTNKNTCTNDQSIISRSTMSSTHITNNINFASAVATEKTPSREQALVFNSMDGTPKKRVYFSNRKNCFTQ